MQSFKYSTAISPKVAYLSVKSSLSYSFLAVAIHAKSAIPVAHILLKVIFSDESGQNLTLVRPTQYEGRSHVKSG